MTEPLATPPRSTLLIALYMRVMFCAAFDGLEVGQVRWGGPDLPSCPLTSKAARLIAGCAMHGGGSR